MKTTLRISAPRPPVFMAENIVYKQAPSWYGADNHPLKLNVIRSWDNAPHPAILWLTGGAWQNITKSVHIPELIFLAEAGFTVVTAEYRATNECPFPGQLEDVKAAVRFLRANAKRWGIDPAHIGVMGESAGGHLASLLGLTGDERQFDVGENPDVSSAVQAVCPWYGPSDFSAPEMANHNYRLSFLMLIGTDSDKELEKMQLASPVYHVKKGAPPFLLIHGTEDTTVPFSQSEALYEKLTQAGAQAELVAIEGASHGDSRFFASEVRSRILEFFRNNLM